MKRIFYLTMMSLLLIATLVGRQGTPATPPAVGAEIKIDNFSFTPTALTVPAGTEVIWTNRDDIPHNVVSEDKRIKSKVLDTNDTFSFTFAKPGTYSYFCSLHPKMKGTVIVR